MTEPSTNLVWFDAKCNEAAQLSYSVYFEGSTMKDISYNWNPEIYLEIHVNQNFRLKSGDSIWNPEIQSQNDLGSY